MSFRPPKTIPILSIFHNARNNQSRAALQLLQQQQKKPNGDDAYRIDIVDDAPTEDQLRQMASYLTSSTPAPWSDLFTQDAQNKVVDWITAQKLVETHPEVLKRPIVVDWDQGRAAIGSPTLDAITTLIQDRLKHPA